MLTAESAKIASSFASGLAPHATDPAHPIERIAADPARHIVGMRIVKGKEERGVYRVQTGLGIQAVYKPSMPSDLPGHAPNKDVPTDMLALAAHRLSKVLGFHAVPHVSRIDMSGMPRPAEGHFPEPERRIGHIQHWIDGPTGFNAFEQIKSFRDDPSLHEVAAMHWISHDRDGHCGNMGIELGPTPAWRNFDHDYAFSIHPTVLTSPNEWSNTRNHIMSDAMWKLPEMQIPLSIRIAAKRFTPEKAQALFSPLGFPPYWSAWASAKASMLAGMKVWPSREEQRDPVQHVAEAAKRTRSILGIP